MNSEEEIDYFGLLIYGFLALLVISLSFGIFGVSSWFFDGEEIAALTAFATALTGFTSIILIGIYRKQTRIFRRHGEILENQTELMELEYTPDISRTSGPSFSGDTVCVSLSNVAKGYANDVRLTTRIEFEGSLSYSSPVQGHSPLNKSEGENQEEGTNSLAPNEETEVEAPALLSIDDGEQRTFRHVVDNLAAEEVEKIRVSMEAEAKNSAGEVVTSCAILPEDHFYADISECEAHDLEEVHKSSTPAQ
ncbi:hypothetical protein KY092_15285 [Natronomonas gomsonensis]|uniref:hypothetical protein n=1 Tax=Natronomonas gomsonensis TaxID=1046043 RepID=UPI0020CA4E83|nr:hypothetical protein [Natronomonas gomsonensis]MCY4731923.1 hypothetical protein [Natronomonas gomsonensis]